MDFPISWKLCKDFRQAVAMVCFLSSILLSVPQSSLAWTPTWVSASSFGGSGTDRGGAAKVDRDGNRYVTGAFSATAYFPLRAAAEQGEEVSAAQAASARKALVSAGGLDVFLAKYDPLRQAEMGDPGWRGGGRSRLRPDV